MPLLKSSTKRAIKKNIKEMRKAGHPPDVSIAAALETARRSKKKRK